MTPEPIFDLAHLGHMELLTPKPDESLKFFVDVMGMTISGRMGELVYLRGWDDYERYSLKLTASKTSGMEHMALRARSPQALERRVAALKGSGFDIGWTDGDLGHGPAFRCRDPDGHIVELYYETEWYQAPPELKPALKNQAQRFPARGINVRRLDHLNCLAVDIKANRIFFEKYLGCRLTEQIVLNDGTEAAMWMTMSNKSYDFAYSHDHSNTPGRFHHVTYALDSREDVLRAADIFLENGVFIETGPHKHAIQQTFFLYVYEPGGNRVEVANAGARLILAPDWKPIVWTEDERKKGQAWGLKTIEFVPYPWHAAGWRPISSIATIASLASRGTRRLLSSLAIENGAGLNQARIKNNIQLGGYLHEFAGQPSRRCFLRVSPRFRIRHRRPAKPGGSRCSTARTSTISTRSVTPTGGSRTAPSWPTRATAFWSPRTATPTFRSAPNSGSSPMPTAASSFAAPTPRRSPAENAYEVNIWDIAPRSELRHRRHRQRRQGRSDAEGRRQVERL